MLGITLEHAEWVRERLLEAAKNEEATVKECDIHGQRYEIVFDLTGPNGNTKSIVSGWIIDTGETTPRLASVYPKADN